MKNLDLNSYGVQEMNVEEMKTIEGGIWAIFAMVIGYTLGVLIKSLFE